MKTLLVVLVVLAVSLSGCTSFGASRMFEGSDAGFVMLAGDAEGIRAYNDGLIGHITEGKAAPETKSPYWQTREQETAIKTLRFKKVQK